MSKTLVTVAQRAKARFFRYEGPGKGLTEIEDLVHPASRAHEGDLVTDDPGRVKERAGPATRSYGDEDKASKHEAKVFAKQVAQAITDYRTKEQYDRLILVAGPGFLGLLRESLDGPSQKMIDGEVDKELTHLKAEELAERLEDVVAH
ncbi:MAG TPA: host attachment protein [Sandaracinaceae bacterium LLY-WYZ-13_1]|nr:host attachment protein [Sandaracinaceae bacterium LLY-WYZ-13_1]